MQETLFQKRSISTAIPPTAAHSSPGPADVPWGKRAEQEVKSLWQGPSCNHTEQKTPDREGGLERGNNMTSSLGRISLCPQHAAFLIQFGVLIKFKLFELTLITLFLPPQGVSASLPTPKALAACNGELQSQGNVGLKENVPQFSCGFSS